MPTSGLSSLMNRNKSALQTSNRVLSADRVTKANRASITASVLRKLGLEAENPGVFCGEWLGGGKVIKSISPINGEELATVRTASAEQYERAVECAQAAFQKWQMVPAPK